jgi:Pentatricopeptide repeat domain
MAQKILDEMLQHSTSKKAVRPDRVVFNAVMDAWKNDGGTQAGIQATKILRQMQKQSDPSCHPDTISYNTAIASWAHSGHANAAPQAERLLHEMIVSFREAQATATTTLAVPNTVSYNSVLHAHAKSGHEQAASRAEAILRAMIRDAENGNVIPDVYSFTTVMDTLAKSKAVPGKALRARALLDQLIGRGLQPSCVTFNTILNACKWNTPHINKFLSARMFVSLAPIVGAFSALGTTDSQKREALQIAVTTFTMMRQHDVLPDMVSYGNLLKAISNLLPVGQNRNDMALQVFGKCIGDGMVGELAWHEVRRAVVPVKEVSRRFSLNGSPRLITLRDLPLAWRQHVRGDKSNQFAEGLIPSGDEQSVKGALKARTSPERRLRAIKEPSFQSGRDV